MIPADVKLPPGFARLFARRGRVAVLVPMLVPMLVSGLVSGATCVALVACGAGQKDSPPPASGKNAPEGGVSINAAADAGADGGRPFAGSIAEATSLISAAIESRQNEIARCVGEFRLRKNLAHEKVAVQFGIDQEGRLLGVTSKGKEDGELKTCVKTSLAGAPFPRSHAGIITVTKTYEEITK